MQPIGSDGQREDWTLVVVAEDGPASHWTTRDCRALRYAFVSSSTGRGGGGNNPSDDDDDDDDDGVFDAAGKNTVLCEGPEGFLAYTVGRGAVAAAVQTEEGAFVPERIRHLVGVCERDEIDDVVGPFRDRLDGLRLEREEWLRRRMRGAVEKEEDGMAPSEQDPPAAARSSS